MDDRAWATEALLALVSGEPITVRPRGQSMRPRIEDGDRVTLAPCRSEEFAIGDMVLARVRGHLLVLHQIHAVEADRFLIGNASGRTDEWVKAEDVFGRVTALYRRGE